MAGLVAVDERAKLRLVPSERTEVTVYEAVDPAAIVTAASAVGVAAASPWDLAPGPGALGFYQLDDGVGLPRRIRVVKAGAALRFTF